jgi:hypothetical protein
MAITTCHRGLERGGTTVGSVIESQMTSTSGGDINMIIVSLKKMHYTFVSAPSNFGSFSV